MRRSRLFRIISSLIVALGFTAIAWAGLSANILGGWQLRFSDKLFPGTGADPRIAVVGIDANSLTGVFNERNQSWPWTRDVHAQIVDNLAQAGAKLIVYDLLFDPGRPEDQVLADAETRAGNVILSGVASFQGRPQGGLLQAKGFTPPVPLLADAAFGIGHANVTPDPDQFIRSLPLVVDHQGDLVPSLAFETFAAIEGQDSGAVTLRGDGVQVGNDFVPTGEAHILNLNFADTLRDGVKDAPVLSAVDVLDDRFPPSAVKDKVVFVGVTDPTLGDNKLTPVDSGAGLPGVFVHANALNTMLESAYITPASTTLNVVAVFVVSLLIALAVQFLPVSLASVTPIALGFGYLLFVFNRFDQGTQYNMVYPNLGIVVAFVGALGVRYFTEVRERRRVLTAFGRYLAKDVVEEVLAAPEGPVATLKGVNRPLAILFADLRGFTAASENATPPEVVAALNIYLDAMTRAVIDEKGTIDKFMGDCVMAFWGAPKAQPDYAVRCVRAGLRMQDYIDQAMLRTEAARLQVKGCGVGISAGDAVVGNIGSSERLDYTVIGDTVNTASRLCGVAGPGEIVITQDCADLLGEEFRLGSLPPLSVKGKTLPLTVFQVLREGQEQKTFDADETMDATEEKGHFEPSGAKTGDGGGEASATMVREAPSVAAGYAPVEPVAPASPSEGDGGVGEDEFSGLAASVAALEDGAAAEEAAEAEVAAEAAEAAEEDKASGAFESPGFTGSSGDDDDEPPERERATSAPPSSASSDSADPARP